MIILIIVAILVVITLAIVGISLALSGVNDNRDISFSWRRGIKKK